MPDEKPDNAQMASMLDRVAGLLEAQDENPIRSPATRLARGGSADRPGCCIKR